jgi:hypothetical protein
MNMEKFTKIAEYFESLLTLTVALFIIGTIVCFFGCLMIAMFTAMSLMVFGGIVGAVGAILIIIAFFCLVMFIIDNVS